MRVSIGHREAVSGSSGADRHYFVECEVLFSEEEKAIMAARGLLGHTFTLDPSRPPPSPVQYASKAIMRRIGWIMLPSSAVIGIGFNGPLGDLLGMTSVGLLIAAYFMDRSVAVAELPHQTISFQALQDNPRFTVFASDPVRAKNADATIRNILANIKALLVNSTEIPNRETFEL